MRIAILGANGQIGRVLFAGLSKQFPAAEILGCVRKNKLHFEGVAGNHLQRSVVFNPLEDDWKLLGKLNVIINCIGAIDEVKNPFEKTHILPALNMIDNRELLGNPRIIQISALGASPLSISRFMRTKHIADASVLNQPDAFVVKPSIVCTHETMLVKSIHRLQKFSRFTFGRIPVPQKFMQTKIQSVDPKDVLETIVKIVNGEISKREIEVVGADQIALSKLLEWAELHPIVVPQKVADVFWKIFKPALRNFLNDEQYQLLKQDNIASENETAAHRRSTLAFWKNELTQLKKKTGNSVLENGWAI